MSDKFIGIPVSNIRSAIEACKEEDRMNILVASNAYHTLPLYSTPPSGRKCRKMYNPFSRSVRERLGGPVFSPTVFKNVISPSEVMSDVFYWTIDDIARCKPAEIEDKFGEDDHQDIDQDESVQETIEKYFASADFPSPLEAPKYCSSPLPEVPPTDQVKHTARKITITKNLCTQTELQLVSIPDQVERVLESLNNDEGHDELRMSVDCAFELGNNTATEHMDAESVDLESDVSLPQLSSLSETPVNSSWRNRRRRTKKGKDPARVGQVSVQTDLSFPPRLVSLQLDSLIRPFSSAGHNEEEEEGFDDSPLRRRLQFNENCDDEVGGSENMINLSPSPPLTGRCFQAAGTPLAGVLRPSIGISPIFQDKPVVASNAVNRSKVSVKLDFSDDSLVQMECQDTTREKVSHNVGDSRGIDTGYGSYEKSYCVYTDAY